MELTKEILINNGFESNHPERILSNFCIHGVNPEYRINLDSEYYPLSNKLGFNISCWKCDERGVITKRASVGLSNTVEDLQKVIDLCDIDKLIYV